MTEQSFSNLTPQELERLALFVEEAGEALQAVGKIFRHGYNSCHPDHPNSPNNRGSLEREVADLTVAIDLLLLAGDLDSRRVHELMVSKSLRVPRFLHHQSEPLLKKLRDYYE